eukprot:10420570-Prorocentrum_lima.AAC.1
MGTQLSRAGAPCHHDSNLQRPVCKKRKREQDSLPIVARHKLWLRRVISMAASGSWRPKKAPQRGRQEVPQ